MNLHIDLAPNHPVYDWVEKQAEKIGAKGDIETHIDCPYLYWIAAKVCQAVKV